MSDQSDFANQVLEYLQQNSGKRFECYRLARTFEVSTTSMRTALLSLDKSIEVEVHSKDRVYFVRAEEEKQRIAGKINAPKMERPKRDTRAMAMAMDRCRELYPNGTNFKSIS